jgi:hypothetical protein
MKGNPVTPDTALLVYRLVDGDRGALASIDGYHLTNALRLISRYANLVLQVGPNWLDADGKVRDTAVPRFEVAHHHLTSQRYDYSVDAGMPAGEVWRFMQSRYPAVFSLLVFFGVLAGGSHTGCKNACLRLPMSCSARWLPMNSFPISNPWYMATRAHGRAARC